MKSKEVTNPFIHSPKNLEKLRQALESSTEDNDRFYENLRLVGEQIDDSEISLKRQGYRSTIAPNKWTKVIKILNCKLTQHIKEHSMLQIQDILNFSLKFFYSTRRRTHNAFISSVGQLIKLDDWDIVVKALKIMAEYSTRNKGADALFTEEIMQWLMNIALGVNLKASIKVSTLEMLREVQEIGFEYYADSDVPSIRNVRLSHLKGNKEDSFKLVQEIAKSSDISQSLFPALWCKVRIAKIEDHSSDKYKMVLASLLAYKIYCILLL